ncbi:hypothetical protein [Actinoplanes sp. NPDC051494]|uniref:hypothetical protein n=1 Tax=Actinoplanes sp. NPDC051494 TaxID=3363907 RepID=UPI003795F110
MITRWLPLYLRSRRVTLAVPVSLAAIVAVMAIWSAWARSPEVSPRLAVLTLLFALAPWIPTLAGPDDALEKTAALLWSPRRVLHLVTFGAVVAGALIGARLADIEFGAAGQLARNSFGLAGLIGLGVALVGTSLAPIVPIVWVAVQATLAATGGPLWRQALLWLMQPADNRPAAIMAGVLLLAGGIAYAVRASPPTPPNEATMGQ